MSVIPQAWISRVTTAAMAGLKRVRSTSAAMVANEAS